MIGKINSMIQLIKECPELFHDGIDEELIDLLNEIKKEIIKWDTKK